MKKVNQQFKLLSAVAILAVVAGHCSNAGVGAFFTWFNPYQWHLPLFVFISGYFYKSPAVEEYVPFIKKKFIRLMIPLYAYNLIYGIFSTALNRLGYHYSSGFSLRTLLLMPLVNGHQFRFNCPTWYVTPLFVCFLLYPVLDVFGKKLRHKDTVLSVLLWGSFIAVCRYCVTYVRPDIQWQYDLKIFICRASLMIPFFHFGKCFRQRYENLLRKFRPRTVILSCLAVQFLLLWIQPSHRLDFSLCWQNDFENKYPLLLILGAVNAIVILYEITGLLLKKMQMPPLLTRIADSTYCIMTNHLLGFWLLNTLIAVFGKLTGSYLGGFSMEDYRSQIYYTVAPFSQFRILYLIAGIAVSLLISALLNRMKAGILRRKKRGKCKDNRA